MKCRHRTVSPTQKPRRDDGLVQEDAQHIDADYIREVTIMNTVQAVVNIDGVFVEARADVDVPIDARVLADYRSSARMESITHLRSM